MAEVLCSRLVFGTVALGLPYGLPPVGASAPVLVDAATAQAALRSAWAAGITTFDTAPAYGVAEERVGAALGADGEVWTKLPPQVRDVEAALASIAQSCARLQRPRLALVQWHNWTRALGEDASFRAVWSALADDPRVAGLGASTYGPDDALAAVESGIFRVVQVEWNVLNQRVVTAITAAARAQGVRVAVRSVYLQGLLVTPVVPPRYAGLAPSIARFQHLAQSWSLSPAALALRAALDHPGIDYVLVGLDRPVQLEAALAACARPVLTDAQRDELIALDRGDDPLTDPRTWAKPA